MYLLETQNLTLLRNERIIVQNISLSIQSGEILQIRGPNGSGKTSLLRMLSGIILPTAGEIYWGGELIHDIHYQRNLLYQGHLLGLKSMLTVNENLLLFAKEPEIREVLLVLNLLKHQNDFVKDLSAGQQRRLTFAKFLLKKAPLWLLDEPFTALDQATQKLVESLIRKQVQQGGMVILTSHQGIDLNVKYLDLILNM
ncbi:MAG: cytochrome c biogenesis heme-transporting ATPase CcmA [Gammaproteobacteria bacterium]